MSLLALFPLLMLGSIFGALLMVLAEPQSALTPQITEKFDAEELIAA